MIQAAELKITNDIAAIVYIDTKVTIIQYDTAAAMPNDDFGRSLIIWPSIRMVA